MLVLLRVLVEGYICSVLRAVVAEGYLSPVLRLVRRRLMVRYMEQCCLFDPPLTLLG